MSYDLKNIQVLGYTTDFQQCECCGKENLKGTVSILDMNSDVVLHFGTTCAVKADKYDTLEAFNKAKKEVSSLKRDIETQKQFAGTMKWKLKIAEEKFAAMLNDYLSFMSVRENRIKRFTWEAYL